MKKGSGTFPCNRMNLAHDDWQPDGPGQVRAGSLEYFVCALEHENGVGDLKGGAQLDAHYLHNVGLGQQQEGLPVNHLGDADTTMVMQLDVELTGQEKDCFVCRGSPFFVFRFYWTVTAKRQTGIL